MPHPASSLHNRFGTNPLSKRRDLGPGSSAQKSAGGIRLEGLERLLSRAVHWARSATLESARAGSSCHSPGPISRCCGCSREDIEDLIPSEHHGPAEHRNQPGWWAECLLIFPVLLSAPRNAAAQ